MSTINVIDTSLSGQTGSGKFVGDTAPTFASTVTFNSAQGITDTSGNFIMGFYKITSAVNYIYTQNAATAGSVVLAANGSDTNINLIVAGHGTGDVRIFGAGTNSDAPAGYVGEFVSSSIVYSSAVSLTNNTAKNVTSISLTAGDWDISGNVFLFASVTMTQAYGWISTASASVPDSSLLNGSNGIALTGFGVTSPSLRFSLSTTTTIYLSAYCSFASGTATACGNIYARRRR